MTKTINFDTLKKEWLNDTDFCKAYQEVALEYEIALQLIKARTHSGLTQEEIAARMQTTQSVIARLESGKGLPSMKTLSKYAQATGQPLHVRLGA